MGTDGDIAKPVTIKRRRVEIQYVDLPKVKDIEDFKAEHKDEKKRWENTRAGLILILQKAAQCYKNMSRIIIMQLLRCAPSIQTNNNYSLICCHWPPLIPKATHIQCNEGDKKLALWLALTEYYMTETDAKDQYNCPKLPHQQVHIMNVH